MVVDESGSIGKWNFKKVKSFLKDMISRFSVTPFGAHFGIVKYSTYPRLVFSLTKYTNVGETQTAVQNMEYRGGATYTGRALALARTQVITFFSAINVHDKSRGRQI